MPNHTVLCWDNWQLDLVLFNGSNFKDSVRRLCSHCWAARLRLENSRKKECVVCFFFFASIFSHRVSFVINTWVTKKQKNRNTECYWVVVWQLSHFQLATRMLMLTPTGRRAQLLLRWFSMMFKHELPFFLWGGSINPIYLSSWSSYSYHKPYYLKGEMWQEGAVRSLINVGRWRRLEKRLWRFG